MKVYHNARAAIEAVATDRASMVAPVIATASPTEISKLSDLMHQTSSISPLLNRPKPVYVLSAVYLG